MEIPDDILLKGLITKLFKVAFPVKEPKFRQIPLMVAFCINAKLFNFADEKMEHLLRLLICEEELYTKHYGPRPTH